MIVKVVDEKMTEGEDSFLFVVVDWYGTVRYGTVPSHHRITSHHITAGVGVGVVVVNSNSNSNSIRCCCCSPPMMLLLLSMS